MIIDIVIGVLLYFIIFSGILGVFSHKSVWNLYRYVNLLRIICLLGYSIYDSFITAYIAVDFEMGVLYNLSLFCFIMLGIFIINIFIWGLFSWYMLIVPIRLGYLKALKVNGIKYRLLLFIPLISGYIIRNLQFRHRNV